MGRGATRARAAASVALVVAVLATASCGLFRDPLLDVVTGITGGECFTGAPEGGFDVTTEVPCDQPHAWEVVGTVPVPEGYEDADYDEVVSNGRLRDDVFRSAMRACVPQVAQLSGVSAALEGADPFGSDALVWPGFAGRVVVSTTPEAVWEDTRTLFCVIEWRDVRGASMPVTSASPDEPAIASFTKDAPPEQRVCRVYDLVGRLNQAPCARPHDAEYLFTYDAMVHGADFVADVDPADVTVEQWIELDRACRAAANGVFGVERAQPDLAVIADVRPELWGKGPFGPETYLVACMVLPSDPAMLLDGPVWGLANEPATLVPGDA